MDTLILNGHDLTLQDVYDVAYDGRKVEIAADAYARLAKGREIMQELSKGGKAISAALARTRTSPSTRTSWRRRTA